MLFNSIQFAIFLPITFFLYWFVLKRNLNVQNLFLLIVSYVFYGWWDWRFLSLIIISSLVDYLVGLKIPSVSKQRHKTLLLLISLSVNLGLLGFFKYYNFFVESFIDAFSVFGIQLHSSTLSIILPVGISFYTFQTLSYTIDIYREKLKPTKNIITFFAFVAFFPQLVAGPIERAANLLPQLNKPRHFDYERAKDGLRQILWGLFKKVVIADTCAIFVNDIFANHELYSGSILLLGGIYFAFQIYGDFSGYSDIAIGTARLFGISLMRNFNYPYFSRDIAEFWRRWHISLSTWFRDYVYIPLGGSHGGTRKILSNIMIIFLVSGFWHGANWTFLAWGAINALYFIPLYIAKKNRDNLNIVAENSILPSFRELVQVSVTFFLTIIAWIFFRAESIGHALSYLSHLFTPSLFSFPDQFRSRLPMIFAFVVWEWIQRKKQHGLAFDNVPVFFRWAIYVLLFNLVIYHYDVGHTFIYFQF